MSWLSVILGLLSGVVQGLLKVFDAIKTQELINQGRTLEQADRAKDEIEINRQQTEILAQNQSKEETIKKLEDGTF